MMRAIDKTAKYTWFVLFFNIGVVLWGAVVRATGSGAGCGSHWPLCNGEVVPQSIQMETAIELTHRVTSGLALLLVAGMVVIAFRRYPQGHPFRLGAGLSLAFILSEALLGAGLVLFEWVADDASTSRSIAMSLHLINTFLLLASLTLAGYWASGGDPVRLKGRGSLLWLFGFGLILVLALGVSGAITALGDTLFPSASLAQGIRDDFSPTAHFLIRLRVWHPVLAVLTSFFWIFVSGLAALFRTDRRLRQAAAALIAMLVLQLGAGAVNVILLAPVWMQIVHLLLADTIWVLLILLSARVFQVSPGEQTVAQSGHSLQASNARQA